MADLHPVAGSKIYIGGTKATSLTDFTASDFSSVTWQEIDGWSQCGTIGDNATVITTQLINRSRDIKQKGTANAGNMQNVFAKISGDAGQSALLTAAAASNKNNYAFKIAWADGLTWYFVGLVMSEQRAGGGANTINNINCTIEVNSNISEA